VRFFIDLLTFRAFAKSTQPDAAILSPTNRKSSMFVLASIQFAEADRNLVISTEFRDTMLYCLSVARFIGVLRPILGVALLLPVRWLRRYSFDSGSVPPT
jgi:hypothetical protein